MSAGLPTPEALAVAGPVGRFWPRFAVFEGMGGHDSRLDGLNAVRLRGTCKFRSLGNSRFAFVKFLQDGAWGAVAAACANLRLNLLFLGRLLRSVCKI
jgi:hypothetical protein